MGAAVQPGGREIRGHLLEIVKAVPHFPHFIAAEKRVPDDPTCLEELINFLVAQAWLMRAMAAHRFAL
jgi:hypothetical protein